MVEYLLCKLSRIKSYYSSNNRFFIILLSFLIIFFLESPANAQQIHLKWAPNSEPDMDHYVVYWGTASRSYKSNSGNIGLNTTYSLTIPNDGKIYYFAVKAFDNEGLASDFSIEANTGKRRIKALPWLKLLLDD